MNLYCQVFLETCNDSLSNEHHEPAFSSSFFFFASLAALLAFRFSSANLFFSSLDNFFSYNPFTSTAGTSGPLLFGGAPGLVVGGAIPGSYDSGTWAAIPAEP